MEQFFISPSSVYYSLSMKYFVLKCAISSKDGIAEISVDNQTIKLGRSL